MSVVRHVAKHVQDPVLNEFLFRNGRDETLNFSFRCIPRWLIVTVIEQPLIEVVGQGVGGGVIEDHGGGQGQAGVLR